MKLILPSILYRIPLVIACTTFLHPAVGQELAPDDPAIAANLGAWFKDAADTFDPDTGIWADSSGNDRHAVPVGEVNVGGPVTYLAPTLSTISGGAFSEDDLASVRFANDVDDLLVADGLNGDAGLTDLTIFAVYHVDFLSATPNLTRPLGFGSLASLQANPGDHFNLASDPSIRKDNGQLGSGEYALPFPALTTFIRTARMSPTAVDDWFNVDGTLQNVLNLPGVSYTTSSDDYFMGDLRAGATPIPGFGASLSLADLNIVQTIIYNAALSDEQVSGVNEWLVSNVSGGGGSTTGGFQVTQITLSEDNKSATLTWRSKSNKNYAIDLSYDLALPWEELDDSIPSDGPDTTTRSVPTFNGAEPDPLPSRVFYRVREV